LPSIYNLGLSVPLPDETRKPARPQAAIDRRRETFAEMRAQPRIADDEEDEPASAQQQSRPGSERPSFSSLSRPGMPASTGTLSPRPSQLAIRTAADEPTGEDENLDEKVDEEVDEEEESETVEDQPL
jgi:hypothetical protein